MLLKSLPKGIPVLVTIGTSGYQSRAIPQAGTRVAQVEAHLARQCTHLFQRKRDRSIHDAVEAELLGALAHELHPVRRICCSREGDDRADSSGGQVGRDAIRELE